MRNRVSPRSTVWAVSYTHLDLYKRQSSSVARAGLWHKIGSAVAVIVALIFDWLIAMILVNIPGITLPFDYSVFLGPVVRVWYIVTEPVSYTHLDVYKRQD